MTTTDDIRREANAVVAGVIRDALAGWVDPPTRYSDAEWERIVRRMEVIAARLERHSLTR